MVLYALTLTTAQDVASGPEKGKKVPALKVYDGTGPNQGKEVDYAKERKDAPTVYLFIQADKWDRPMARFVVKLDEALRGEEKQSPVVAVWLTETPDKTKEYLPVAQQSLKLEATALTCFTGEKAGPAGWGINGDAHLTAVVANKSKVAAVFGYVSVNETVVPEVLNAVRQAKNKK
jgi:hypothetical protein